MNKYRIPPERYDRKYDSVVSEDYIHEALTGEKTIYVECKEVEYGSDERTTIRSESV